MKYITIIKKYKDYFTGEILLATEINSGFKTEGGMIIPRAYAKLAN